MRISLNSRVHRDLVAELIRLRKQQGLSQRALARRLHRSQSYVALIEKGQKHIDLFEFVPYVVALGVDPEEMFRRYAVRGPAHGR